MKNTKGIRMDGVFFNCHMYKIVEVIPLNAALQFWNPTMASFMQKVKKLSTPDVFLFYFSNKLVQWRKQNLKLQFSTAKIW